MRLGTDPRTRGPSTSATRATPSALGTARYRVGGREVTPAGAGRDARLSFTTPRGSSSNAITARSSPTSKLAGRTTPTRAPVAATGAASARLGTAAWSGHYASLSYAWGIGNRWGCYSYPYSYCATLPSYYGYCDSAYGRYGSCWGLSYCTSFWPRWCYWPTSWCFSGGWDWWCNSPYDLWYYPRSSYVVYDTAEYATDSEPAESLADIARRHLELGDLYFREGRFEEAAEAYTRALAYAPDDGSIHFLIADALFARGDYHYAAHMITKALVLDPDLATADADKRTFYGEPKLFDDQLEALRNYLTEKPFDAAAHLVLGYNLRFSGDPGGARVAFGRVLEIDPGDRTATELLAGTPK